MFNYFPDGYGLVTKHDPTTENCNLFYAEYLEPSHALGVIEYEYI